MPLAVGAMTLLSVPFVLGVMRVASTGQRMMIGSLVGVAFHLTSQISARLGLLLNLSPAVTALAPVLVVLAVTAWRFRRIG
jgi:lipopolysaccharide export system permease protein